MSEAMPDLRLPFQPSLDQYSFVVLETEFIQDVVSWLGGENAFEITNFIIKFCALLKTKKCNAINHFITLLFIVG